MVENLKMIMILIIGLCLVPIVHSALVCTISNSTCNDTDIFHMSNLVDAHAELNNESNYNYTVCCTETSGGTIKTSCGEEILHLSANTNAHVEKSNLSNYNKSVCIDSDTGTVSCRYQLTPCLDACLGTISTAIVNNETNLHIADCTTDQYETYICCSYVGASVTTGGGGSILPPSPPNITAEEEEQPIIPSAPAKSKIIISALIMGGLVFGLIILSGDRERKRQPQITSQFKKRMTKELKKSDYKNKEIDKEKEIINTYKKKGVSLSETRKIH